MAKRAGRPCPELIQPEISIQVLYLWRWFCEVSQGRQSAKLSWTELKAWTELTNKKPNEWEISTIRAIDREYMQ